MHVLSQCFAKLTSKCSNCKAQPINEAEFSQLTAFLMPGCCELVELLHANQQL